MNSKQFIGILKNFQSAEVAGKERFVKVGVVTSIAWFFRGYSAKLPEEEWLRKVVAQSYVHRIGQKNNKFWKDAFGNAQGAQEISQAVVVAKLVALGSCSYHRSSHGRTHLPAAWGRAFGCSRWCAPGDPSGCFFHFEAVSRPAMPLVLV